MKLFYRLKLVWRLFRTDAVVVVFGKDAGDYLLTYPYMLGEEYLVKKLSEIVGDEVARMRRSEEWV